MDVGGQVIPISILGAIDLWKYVQKNATKNISSEMMNKIILILISLVTVSVWNPWNVLSRTTSRHHWIRHIIIVINLIINSVIIFVYANKIIPKNMFMMLIDVNIGHGLIVTIWNGWLVVVIIRFVEV